MIWSYSYDPQIWPALITLASLAVLGWYAWGRRGVPGAAPFAVGCFFAFLWASGTALEISAVDFSTQVFWAKFQAAWQLPTVTAFTCFILAYAGFGRFLNRRNLVLLSIPPLVFLILVATNDYHHLVWSGFQMDGDVVPSPVTGNRIFLAYGYLLGLANVTALVWLAIRSPRNRWPAAIMLFGQLTARTMFMVEHIYGGFPGPGEAILAIIGVQATSYGLAFFRFHVLDPLPAAHIAAIEQMVDGMLVLDLDGRIVDSNPAASRMFKESQSALLGRPAAEIFALDADLLNPDRESTVQSEISLGDGKAARQYNLSVTVLKDRHGQALGRLLVFHETTEQRRAQALLVEQQRVLATTRERERLAHELHDSTAQVLGYVSIQALAIQKWLSSGDIEKAQSLLSRLEEVSQDAHTDVRESILSLKAGAGRDWSFVSALKKYLSDIQALHGMRTKLFLTDGLKEGVLKPGDEVQILRVIQEAITNARKHGRAQSIGVTISHDDGRVSITVTDDGSGFDLTQVNPDTGRHFGLVFMRERMEQIGGSLAIHSHPGEGTVVNLEATIAYPQEDRQ
jgi:PAS domain S-box-containing protein